MSSRASSRIQSLVAALPLRPDMHVLEIGCGPGVAARLAAEVLTEGQIVAIDRSAKAIAQARAGSTSALASGRLEFRQCAIEDFVPEPGEPRFDLAFAMRVGALDGRHPELERLALARLKAALSPQGILCVDDRAPVRVHDISALS